MDEIKPKVLNARIEIQKPERYNSCQGKKLLPQPQQKLSFTSTLLTIQHQACACELCRARELVHTCWPYIGHLYL
jgi:hypothetical protein